MDHLREMEAFLQVAEGGSFTHAAKQLGVSRSTITKIIAALEERLGLRLLIRSTHHVSLTSAGELFATEAKDILSRVANLHQSISQEQTEMTGTIRMGAPPSFAAVHVVQAIAEFRGMHPELKFDLVADDGSLNLVKEGMDFSIRIAPILPDTSLVAKLLVRVPQLLVASPDYLARRGTPRALGALAGHDCLVHKLKSPGAGWQFNDDEIVKVTGPFTSDLGEVLREAALSGQGLSIHPTYMIADDLRAGRLVSLLPEHSVDELSIYAVYAERRFRPRRVMMFLEFLKGWLRTRDDWAGRKNA